MRIVSFEIDGEARYGLVDGDRVIDLSSRLPYRDIIEFIGANPRAECRKILSEGHHDVAFADLQLLPVVPNPKKIICIGLNYEEHKREGIRNPDDKPMLFARFADTLVAHGDPMIIPKISDMLDFEAELLVVIGSDTGRYLPANQAIDKVFGYSCMNEGSVRDWQRHSSQVTAGKNFVGTGPAGPWIVTADEIADVQALDLELRINGETMQKANTKDMIWSVADMIEYITQWMPLGPGDLIATGTPAGVGSRRTPPIFLKEGDLVEVSIEQIGTLRNTVERERP